MIEIYVGATYSPSTNMGGWGVVLVEEGEREKKDKGCEQNTTHNQMILRAAIEGLSKTEQDCEVRLFSNSEYLIIGMKDSRQRRGNRELWEMLDELVYRRHVDPQRIPKHKWLDEAHLLAKDAVGG